MSCWHVFLCYPHIKIIPCSDTLTLLYIISVWCSVHFSSYLWWTALFYFQLAILYFIQTTGDLLWTCCFQLWALRVGGESDSNSDSDSDSEFKRSKFSSGEKVRVLSLTQTVSCLMVVLHYGLLTLLSAEKWYLCLHCHDFPSWMIAEHQPKIVKLEWSWHDMTTCMRKRNSDEPKENCRLALWFLSALKSNLASFSLFWLWPQQAGILSS